MDNAINDFDGKNVAVTESFLKGIRNQHINPEIAKNILLPLCHIYRNGINDDWIVIPKEEYRKALHLKSSYVKGRYNEYLDKWFSAAIFGYESKIKEKVYPPAKVDNEQIILDYERDRYYIMIHYNKRVLSKYFENLRNNHRRFFLVGVQDLALMSKKHTFDIIRELLLSCGKSDDVCTFSSNTRTLMNSIGMNYDNNYRRNKDDELARTHFEKYVLTPALDEINKMESISIADTNGKLFRKTYLTYNPNLYKPAVENYAIDFIYHSVNARKEIA